MDFSALQILTLALCAIALAACFVRRVSSALIAYGAMICAHCSGGTGIHTRELVFWGVATAIVLGLRYLLGDDGHDRRAARAYTAGGAAAGAFVGVIVWPGPGGAILGSAAGSFLGAMAYMRMPSSPRYGITSRPFVDFLASRGLPVVVGTSIVAITTVAVLGAISAAAAQ